MDAKIPNIPPDPEKKPEDKKADEQLAKKSPDSGDPIKDASEKIEQSEKIRSFAEKLITRTVTLTIFNLLNETLEFLRFDMQYGDHVGKSPPPELEPNQFVTIRFEACNFLGLEGAVYYRGTGLILKIPISNPVNYTPVDLWFLSRRANDVDAVPEGDRASLIQDKGEAGHYITEATNAVAAVYIKAKGVTCAA